MDRYGFDNDLNLKLVIALKRSLQYLNRDDAKHFKELGITLSQFGVLEALYHKGDLRVSEIVEKTLSTGGNMTVVINNLEKDGYITRYRDPEDGRAFIVSITNRGEEIISDVWPKHMDVIRDKFDLLETKDKEDLLYILKKMNGLV